MDKKQVEQVQFVTKEWVQERIKYLEMELAHRGFWDGWCIKGMEKELKEIQKKLDLYNKSIVN